MRFKGTLAALIAILTVANTTSTVNAPAAETDDYVKTQLVETQEDELLASAVEQTTEEFAVTTEPATTVISKEKLTVSNFEASTISVSCLKLSWDGDTNRSYQIDVTTDAAYSENITFVQKENDLWYLTGLRENSVYHITVIPLLFEGESADDFLCVPKTVTGKTEQVTVIQEYEREEGVTNCFAGERASGLTRMPSSGAIAGSVVDPITETNIRRNEYGDYCCAMGLFYGVVGDRFLIELENGTQFTVSICDSKGMADDANGDGIADGRFHWFGDTGKCIVEFIHDGYDLPSGVSTTGSWGTYNWNGLDLTSNILRIQKIEYGETIKY